MNIFLFTKKKNAGPAALIFSNGEVIGARLDRLGLRPLRSVETAEYIGAMSEAGQIAFSPDQVLRRGRIEAGGMLYFDHNEKRSYNTIEALEKLATVADYPALLVQSSVILEELPSLPSEQKGTTPLHYNGDLKTYQRFVAYYYNQESFKFMMDPMLAWLPVQKKSLQWVMAMPSMPCLITKAVWHITSISALSQYCAAT